MSTQSSAAPAGAAPSATSASKNNNGGKRFLLLVVIPLAAIVAGGYVYLQGGRYVETENAYVKADKIPLSVEVSGRVQQVLVQENQPVKAGQPLFTLDAEPFQLALERKQASLEQVRTDLNVTKASYQEKLSELALARTRYQFALKDQGRLSNLKSQNFVSTSQLDDARQAADVASQQIDSLQKELTRIADSLGGSVDTPVEQLPSYKEALAEVSEARLDLKRTQLVASQDGIVTKLPKAGQYLDAGSSALILVADDLWIEANYPETDLTYVTPGQTVDIRVDTYPDTQWHGVVESLSPLTGSEFSVIPAQNATGNWVKITQRVPVRIHLTPVQNAPQLRAGLSTSVAIDTDHRRELLGLALGDGSWLPSAQAAEAH